MAAVLWNGAVWFGLGSVSIPFAILAWQSVVWLKSGQWPLLVVHDALVYFNIPSPSFEWVGVQTLATNVLAEPLSFIVFIVGMAIAVICGGLATRIENREWEIQKEQRRLKRERNSVQ